MHRFRLFLFCLLLTAFGGAAIFVQARETINAAFAFDSQTRPLGMAEFETQPGPIYLENDSYYWLRMAERMAEEGVLRIRKTAADNAPEGRPIYWSQSIAWMMHLISAWPGFQAEENRLAAASFWINPILQLLSLALLVWALGTLDWRAALFAAAAFLSLGDVSWAFSALRPDHQSLQVLFLLASLLPLLLCGFGLGSPWSINTTKEPGPWLYVASGFSVGAALWISAAATMPVLIVLVAGVCACVLFFPEKLPDLAKARKGWLLWGFSAAITSLAFWLLEFFPSNLSLRLEVNSPLFSLWVLLLGLGVSLAFAAAQATGGRNFIFLVLLASVAGVCALLPAAILFGPVDWYSPRNIYMDRLHNFIMEFYTFPNFAKAKLFETLFGGYHVLLPLAALLLIPALRGESPALRTTARMLLLLALALFAMAFRQIRWFALFAPVLTVSAAFSAAWIFRWMDKKRGGLEVVAWALLAAFVVVCFVQWDRQTQPFRQVIAGKTILEPLVAPVLNKRLAYDLAGLEERPTAILADPDLAPAIQYFARIPVVASFYWENVDGVRDFALFLGDEAGDQARKIAAERKITLVIVPSGHLLPNYVFFLLHGHYDKARAMQNLAAALGKSNSARPPSWLQEDFTLDSIGKKPFSFKGEVLEQYLNIYKVRLD